MSENRDVLREQAARIAELEETVRRKQALAEERQELINTWQAVKEQALADLAAEKQETDRLREALEAAEKRMQGYEKQFAALQQAAAKAAEPHRQPEETAGKAAREHSLVSRIRNKLNQ